MQTQPKTDQKLISKYQKAKLTNHTSTQQKRRNTIREKHYFAVLNHIKELYQQLPGTAYFDVDHKESQFGNPIHHFITRDFRWFLACDECWDFAISFQFENCPLEQQIRALIASLPRSVHAEETTYLRSLPKFFTLCTLRIGSQSIQKF
ncbi:hypothetical protein IDJ77_11550 [Mucilaginibacter sp. ZT4R22]|uniref:Uncharacterized protein n=1 Tax=Mucilaginibacter pankratovii TaxID=2772110 RepID=A0ABR7WSS5_9SPHI|nr:hypothetical protein [Mucilaginibacter pankratovii]MBD1364444.1 hypothetical protein [Mucilaginibacter pankratovii]